MNYTNNRKKRVAIGTLPIVLVALMISSVVASASQMNGSQIAQVAAKMPRTDGSEENKIRSSTIWSDWSPTSSMAPSTIGLDGDFEIQAELIGLTARPTNDIVGTKAFYDIVFVTTTSGAIKRVIVSFPGGTGVPTSAFLNEVEGLGPGTVTKSGNALIYTVNNAVNVPAGTKIRLEYANIINPLQGSYVVTVSTRDSANNFIDGPTQSVPYAIKQKGTNAIADNAITSHKISPSFMKSKWLQDDADGNAAGWNPDGATTFFSINDPAITVGLPTPNAILIVVSDFVTNSQCEALATSVGSFNIQCLNPPPEGSWLNYIIINLPPS